MFALAFLISPVLAEEKKHNEEPIFIESDSLKIDDKKGVSTYKGNVTFRQGTASLHADEIVIYTKARQEIEKIIAEGNPAHFEHDAEDDNKDASGEAKRIEYHAVNAIVILDGEARFRQGDNQFAGNRIEYEFDKKLVRAGKSVAPNDEGRVQIMIQPRSANQKPEAATGETSGNADKEAGTQAKPE